MTYNTKQRTAVLSLLESCETNMTAEQISLSLKRAGTPVGLTTVYRTLSALVKEGCVRKFEEEGGSKYHYVGDHENCCHHLHFKCGDCGKLFCVDCHLLDSITSHIEADHNFIVDSSKTVFYGKCADCAKRNK